MTRGKHIRQISPLVGLAAALCACSSALPGPPTGPRVPTVTSVSEAQGAPTGAVASDPPSAAPAPVTTAAQDPRDLQLEIMTEAVAALRNELARSYGNSQKLTEQGERLRALVSSLRTELGKQTRKNKVLRRRLEALERKLQEIATPPPEAESPEPPLPGSGASSTAPGERHKNSSRSGGTSAASAAPPEGELSSHDPGDGGTPGREGRAPSPGVESE